LQIKTEDRLLHDIENLLRSTSSIGISSAGPLKSLEGKQELLLFLIENERSRLKVWLSPLDVERRHYLSGGSGTKIPSEVSLTP
jgi:phosphatidylinositol 4-kinase